MPERDRPLLRKMHSTIQEESDDENGGFDGNDDDENEEIRRRGKEKEPRKFSPPKTLNLHGKMKSLPIPAPTYSRQLRLLTPIPASPASSASSIDSSHFTYTNHFPHLFTEEKMKEMRKIGPLSEGRSRFGDVSKYVENESMRVWTGAKRKENTQQWAPGQKAAFLREMEEMANLVHSRIARLYGFYIGPEEIISFRDYSPMGTVEDQMHRNGALSVKSALSYMKDLLEGLQFCHNNQPRVLHRNIKASNLLLRTDNHVLLCDFGIENIEHLKNEVNVEKKEERKVSTSSLTIEKPKYVPSTSEISHFRRTLLATAPEILERIFDESAYTEAADIWASGCVLVEMLTLKPPLTDSFNHLDDLALHEELISFSRNNQLNVSPQNLLSERKDECREVYNLLKTMMEIDEDRRPSASQLLLEEEFSEINEVRITIPSSLPTPPLASRKAPHLKVKVPTIEEISKALEKKGSDTKSDSKKSQESTELDGNKMEKGKWTNEDTTECSKILRWYGSRCLLFLSLLFKWMGVVLLSALSLAFVAYVVFNAIFLIYKAIGIVCQCKLNEGFIVLIALILLPILILLTTLCCNNSIEKYKQAKADGSLEKCSYVKKAPKDDIILCGMLVLQGTNGRSKKRSNESLARRKNAESTQHDQTSMTQALRLQSGFAMGVSKLA
ncbi:unnamed protein product, partial [Mesorhabditis belari]|uniref:Protein kinase domain-containing protein n=1 Tax=Mesorhabditis belari TaxID=2138241 RepID=A0AAF3FET3_9BILA